MKISRTETAKFLGVVMDENLSWKQHINYIEKKIAKKCWNNKKTEILFDRTYIEHTV